MPTKSDWLMHNHEDLYNQASQTVNYLTGDVLARIGITGPILAWYNADFLPAHTRFKAAFEQWQNPAERTPTKTVALTDAENDFVKVYRQLYTGYMKSNPLVTDEDLVGAGMPTRHTGGNTPAHKPDTLIVATTDTSKPAAVGLHYRDRQSTGTAKPRGVHGAEIVWDVLDTPPADWSELRHSTFSTRTPAQLVFSGTQRGKTLYFSMRWENTRGEKGPWNEIESVMIP
ncbi:MAG: hypothetical protein LBP50_00140 [Tannerella sp.]|jgi:hypothetical protein|nr:hypothetical protein [Tannerella sp.]